MPNQTTVEIVKEIVRKRIEYRAAYEAALSAKVDELFTSLAQQFSGDLNLIRGETSQYTLRTQVFDAEVQGRMIRLDFVEVFDRLYELFHPHGIAVNLQDESEWVLREVKFNVHIFKTE